MTEERRINRWMEEKKEGVERDIVFECILACVCSCARPLCLRVSLFAGMFLRTSVCICVCAKAKDGQRKYHSMDNSTHDASGPTHAHELQQGPVMPSVTLFSGLFPFIFFFTL